jgi:hypothetical protein
MDLDQALYIPEKAKKKDFHYSWVLIEPKQQTIAQLKGYEPVLSVDPEGQHLKNDPRIKDGQIKVGDVVLMRCLKTAVDKRQVENRKKTRNAVQAIKDDFHSTAASLKIQSFEETSK